MTHTATQDAVVAEGPVVRVSGFVKRYKRHVAIEGVDLTVRRGEIYGLIGPDGAGKSSLLKAIAGVLAYEAGTVEVFGVTVDSERAAERVKGRLGFLPQGLGQHLYPDLSVEENVDFFARLRLVPEADLVARKERLLGLTRLAEFRDRPVKHLSGGMKQKLGLVCTLIHEPALLILDEPTTGVDPVSRRDFWAILAELVKGRGLTALVSTAYMDETPRFHRLSFLFQGKVLAVGEPAALQGPDAGTEEHDPEEVFVALVRRQSVAAPLSPPPPLLRPAPAPADGAAIEARGLVRDFGAFRAVDRVSFQVRPGEIFGLLGANGAGKTTVIKMLTGLLPPTAGEGWVAGGDVRRAGLAIKERIGYLSQAFSLYLDLTVCENLRLFAGLYGLDGRAAGPRVAVLLDLVGLQGVEHDLAGRLPVGVRQRLALACALVHRPRVLFLDEPTSGVDPLGRRRFWEILLRLAREDGVALLVTTHDMGEAEHCDRLALMYAGRVVAEGSPAELKRQVEAETGPLLEIVADRPGEGVLALQRAGFAGATLFGTRIHLFCRDPVLDRDCACRALEATGVAVRSVARRPLSLEDVFVYRVTALEGQERTRRPEAVA
ncbi:ATP-binding cassette domain-containing protein [Nitrospira sp. Kam-Ns4a]